MTTNSCWEFCEASWCEFYCEWFKIQEGDHIIYEHGILVKIEQQCYLYFVSKATEDTTHWSLHPRYTAVGSHEVGFF